jgi:hypothetical protein
MTIAFHGSSRIALRISCRNLAATGLITGRR